MPDIVISEFMDEAAVTDLDRDFSVLYEPALADQPELLRERVADARALIVRNRTQVGQALLAAAPRLEVVGRLGVGLDNIDQDACAARGVRVYPARGANDLAVAEYVITMALLLLREAYRVNGAMLSGEWPRAACMGREASGKVLGLVGLGATARAVIPRARSLGMRVTGHDPYLANDDPVWREVEHRSLDELIAHSDVVSLHVPLTECTRHLIDARRLARVKQGAVLINAARGGVVDEAALVRSLRTGRLAGAALDVFEHEPLTRGAAHQFVGVDNLVLTPHIAGVTRESNQRVSALTAQNVRQVLNGE